MKVSRYQGVVAALALVTGAQGCREVAAQGREAAPRRQPPVVADAAVACPAQPPTGPGACPVVGQSCGYGPTFCRCIADATGHSAQWRCETAFLGPLPPPELPEAAA